MQVVTYNVRGLLCSDLDVNLICSHSPPPDIIVLTETKLWPNEHKSKRVQHMLKGYNIYASSSATGEHARGGVLIAIRNKYALTCSVIVCPSLPATEGHLLVWRLKFQGALSSATPINLAGVYAPSGQERDGQNVRDAIYKRLKTMMSTDVSHLTLLAGLQPPRGLACHVARPRQVRRH